MKIALGVNFYQDYKGLARLFDSIPYGFIDYFIGIDGVYRFYSEKYHSAIYPPISDDKIDLLIGQNERKFKEECIVHLKPHVTEFEKRNAYLEACNDFKPDALIIVDSDEYFIFPEGTEPDEAFTRFRNNIDFLIRKHPNHNVFGIRTYNVSERFESYKPRVWAKPHEMRYLYGSHYHYANVKREKETIDLFKENNICYCQHCPEIAKGVILAHESLSIRSEEVKIRHDEYVAYLKRFEGLVQSYRYNIFDAHKIALSGYSYEDILQKERDSGK